MPNQQSDKSFTGFFWMQSKTVRINFGKGPVGKLAAETNRLYRLDKKFNRLRIDKLKADLNSIDDPLLRFGLLLDYLFAAVLTAAGYSRHAKSRWMRCREGCGHPPQFIIDNDLPLREAPGLAEYFQRAIVLRAIQDARPPAGSNWYPGIAALEDRRQQFGSRAPAAQEDMLALFQADDRIWAESLLMGHYAIGGIASKLASIRRTTREAVLWDAMKVAQASMPADKIDCLPAILLLRRIMCQLWSDHAAEVFQFVTATFPAGLPAFVRKRLTRANHHLNAACRMVEKLERLLLLDGMAMAKRKAKQLELTDASVTPSAGSASANVAMVSPCN